MRTATPKQTVTSFNLSASLLHRVRHEAHAESLRTGQQVKPSDIIRAALTGYLERKG